MNIDRLFTIVGTSSISTVQSHIENNVYNGRKILLLCDIDDTVLRMPGYTGSDAWFRTQADLIRRNAPFKDGRVAVDMEHLNSLLNSIYEAVTPLACDGDETLAFMACCLRHDVKIVFVTARGSETRDITRSHLNVIGLTECQYHLVLCNGQNKAKIANASVDMSGYDDIIFVDDKFDNVRDIAHGISPCTDNQTITCFYIHRSS